MSLDFTLTRSHLISLYCSKSPEHAESPGDVESLHLSFFRISRSFSDVGPIFEFGLVDSYHLSYMRQLSSPAIFNSFHPSLLHSSHFNFHLFESLRHRACLPPFSYHPKTDSLYLASSAAYLLIL